MNFEMGIKNISIRSIISGPPFWEIRRGGGPITEWLKTRRMLSVKREVKEKKEIVERYEIEYEQITIDNANGDLGFVMDRWSLAVWELEILRRKLK